MTTYVYAVPTYDLGELDAQVRPLNLPGFLGLLGAPAEVRVLTSNVLPATDKSRLDAALTSYAPSPTWGLQGARAAAAALLGDPSPAQMVLRGMLLVLLDEINRARAADGLATLTPAQARGAVLAKINAGAADT
jgi:hypothetical protein